MEAAKNKKLTYLLICAVAAVWGIIIYKVLFNEADEDYQLRSSGLKTDKEPYDQYAAKPDTFSLALNYRDPFSDAPTVSAEPIVSTPNAPAALKNYNVPPAAPPVNWAAVRYSGYITNPLSKKLVSIMEVNGQEQMMAEGETFQGLKLLKNKRDSVLVSWQGKQKYIRQ